MNFGTKFWSKSFRTECLKHTKYIVILYNEFSNYFVTKINYHGYL